MYPAPMGQKEALAELVDPIAPPQNISDVEYLWGTVRLSSSCSQSDHQPPSVSPASGHAIHLDAWAGGGPCQGPSTPSRTQRSAPVLRIPAHGSRRFTPTSPDRLSENPKIALAESNSEHR